MHVLATLACAVTTTSLLAVATPASASAGEPAPVPRPALTAYTTTSDGVPRYRIGPTDLPPPVAAGRAFYGELEWRSGTLLRRVRVYVPSTAKPTAPLLISLHGLRNTVVQAEKQQRWRQGAFERGAVVAWAGGHDSSWNAHGCCDVARATGVDDVAYLDRVRALVAALHPVDRRRVFLAGFSNGAMMAYRYACERPGVVAGVLAVAGTMTSPCRPRSAVAVLSVHGTADTRVPLTGTAWSSVLGARLPPARDAVRRYAAVGSGVRSVVRTGLGHAWPTRSQGYDATGQGWGFLLGHPRP